MRRPIQSRITVVDLFAGAGLLSCAFANEAFEIIAAFELDCTAAATYALNLGNHIVVGDLERVAPEGHCDVLVAGPPCQGFSTLGRRDQKDPRNRLSLQVVRWAAVLRPSVVVVENVEAFLRAPIWSALKQGLNRLGYEVEGHTLNAVDYGVPQLRRRSFTIASKRGMPKLDSGRHFGFPVVRQAWAGLSKQPDGRNHHYAPRPSELALRRMKLIPPGGDRRDVLRAAPQLAPPSWRTLNCQVTDVWGRMHWNEPANTLRTSLQNPSKGRYIHPEQNRVITLREAARLHTIDDHWCFAGSPTQIARQIGNSVPLRLGKAVARAVHEVF